MRILFCSPCEVDPRLGAAKMLLEIGEALEAQGCTIEVVGPEHVGASGIDDHPARLGAYLAEHAGRFDVIDFDHKRLAYRPGLFPDGVLAVCRAQLLQHHALTHPIPGGLKGAARLRAYASKLKRRVVEHASLRQSTANFRAAHLSTVMNEPAAEVLAALGISKERILVFPNALEEGRAEALRAASVVPPADPVVAFIGMFGPRKGGPDLPPIMRRLFARVPEARLRLLGTKGMFGTAEEVMQAFPPGIQERVEIVPSFAPETLPDLLEACSVGVFPSYAEGFPLGVLEMLAAALPIVAYDAPGAPEMLPPDWIVPTGDTDAVGDRLAALLSTPETLLEARRRARALEAQFSWADIAARTKSAYEAALADLRTGPAAVSPHLSSSR